MDTSLKRIVAYIIDIAIVTIFVTLISKIEFINPSLDKYNENYVIYNELIEDYNNKEIDNDSYEKKLIDINYELGRTNVINGVVTIISLIFYFGIVQMWMNGQTVGKRILKIRLVSNKEDNKPNIGNYLLRTLILNNILFRLLIIVGVFFLGKNGYYHYSTTISFIESIVESAILIMVVLKSDNRGLHDMIAGTKVIDLNAPVYEDIEVIEEKKTRAIEKVKKENKKNTK